MAKGIGNRLTIKLISRFSWLKARGKEKEKCWGEVETNFEGSYTTPKSAKTNPIMRTMTIMCGNPAIATMPRVDNSQIIKRTPAITLKGPGNASIAQRITRNMRRSQRLIECPFSVNRGMFGKVIPWI